MNGFSVDDEVQVTKPIISGMEGQIGKIICFDRTDMLIPICIKFPNREGYLWFAPSELTKLN